MQMLGDITRAEDRADFVSGLGYAMNYYGQRHAVRKELQNAGVAPQPKPRKPGMVRRIGTTAATAGAIGAGAIGLRNRRAIGYAVKSARNVGAGKAIGRLGGRIGTTARGDVRRVGRAIGVVKPRIRKPRAPTYYQPRLPGT